MPPGPRPAPGIVEPQLATLAGVAPQGDAWLHEVKFDGYRLFCSVADGSARLISRNARDWTARFPEIVDAITALPLTSAVLDGEVAVVRADGKTSFQDLQNRISGSVRGALRYFLFDLLAIDGEDWAERPLLERKRRLALLLAGHPEGAVLQYSDHVVGNGAAFFAQACRYGLEGIISKRKDAPYRPGRSRDWLKVKCLAVRDFVVGGFTAPRGSRPGFGALLIGGFDSDGRLRFCGRAGTGFSDAQLRSLRPELDDLGIENSPFVDGPTGKAAGEITWVRPELVVQVAFVEWTDEGVVRHPAFRAVLRNRDAREVALGRPAHPVIVDVSTPDALPVNPSPRSPAASVARTSRSARGPRVEGVTISNPDKVMYPDSGITKLEVAAYYGVVAGWMTRFVAGRPLTLVRCPAGIGDCFYQKHVEGAVHGAVRRIRITESESDGDYAIVDSPAGIVALAQLGVLEFHTWGSSEQDLEHPDRFTLDLDPDPELVWIRVVEAALDVAGLVRELGLVPFVKTTGGKGLHIVVPIVPRLDWETVKEFSRAIAAMLDLEWPRRYTLSISKEKRQGRILIDYLRNGRGATAVEAYSTRARRGAPVSVPISWDELTAGCRSDAFTLRNMPERLASLLVDPWRDYEAGRRPVTPAMLEAVGLA